MLYFQTINSYFFIFFFKTGIEGGNRQNRFHLESQTPSWAGLWNLIYVPCIYGNNAQTGKPNPLDEGASGLVPRPAFA